MKPDKTLSLIGLATKAGRIASGEFSTEKEVKGKKAKLVVVAQDASENTRKKFQNMCGFYRVPIRYYGSREELGRVAGKEFRASLAVLDKEFAENILKQMDREPEEQLH